MRTVFVAIMMVLVGCQVQKRELGKPVFQDIYEVSQKALPTTRKVEPSGKLVTLTAQSARMDTVLRMISDQTGVSVICEQGLDDAPVTLDMVGEPVEGVLAAISRRMGVQVSKQGGVYVLGQLRPEDRGVLVRRVSRLSKDDLKLSVEVLLSEFGRVSSYTDGLVVVADRVEVLQRVSAMLDSVEQSPADTWVVQTVLIGVNNTTESDFGADVVPTAQMAASLAALSGGSSETKFSVTMGLDSAIKATRTAKGTRLVASPILLVQDGEEGKLSKGTKIPVARKSISSEGTVSTMEFEYVQTGLDFTAMVRDMGDDRGRLKLSISLSEMLGLTTEGAPMTRGQTIATQVVVSSGGVYLLGSLDSTEEEEEVLGPFRLEKKSKNVVEKVYLWVKVFRVGSSMRG